MSSPSQEFREPNPAFQALLTKWRSQDSDNEEARRSSSSSSAAAAGHHPHGRGRSQASAGGGGTPGRLPSSAARQHAASPSNVAAASPENKPTFKKRAIDARRSDRDCPSATAAAATAAATGAASSDSDDGAPRPGRSLKPGGKAKKKGRKIVKTKNVYQHPLKSLREFQPRVVAKTPDESQQILAALRRNFVFSGMDRRTIAPLVDAFELCGFSAGDTIIRQGEPGDFFYVIKSGCVVFQVNGTDVGKAKEGASFGELSLLYTCPRAATVVALEATALFRVDQQTFRFILRAQTRQSEQEKISLLRNVDFLKGLNDADLEKMTRVMTPRVFRRDEVLVQKGERGDAWYVVAEGNVLVKDICVGSTAYEDQTLGPGEYFGERALVTGEKRVANVVGLNKGVAFSIDRDTFEKAVGKMSKLVLKAQDARRLAGVKVLTKAHLDPRQFAALASSVSDQSFRRGQQILTRGAPALPALYFVREGKVEVEVDGRTDLVEAGGYFGEPIFVSNASVVSPCTATVIEDSVCGVLTVEQCSGVFDIRLLPSKPGPDRVASPVAHVPTTSAKLEDLERHAILGEGTFGQVHLVSETLPDGSRRPYALKIQSKKDLEREGQIEAVLREKNIMSQMQHPFLVGLVKTFQDEKFVYILLPMLQGGELFSVLHERDEMGLPESQAKFYALAVADALAYMHSRKCVYRDLKPENVMIDSEGYPVIVDFGFAKYVEDKTYTLCGTPGFVAPEVITQRGHACGADHWSLGILVYELVTSTNPFQYEGMDQIALFSAICQDDFEDPRGVSDAVVDLIRKLLVKDPNHRLGSLARGERDILEHGWFETLNLSAMRARQSNVPWVPKIEDPLDVSNFDDWSHLQDRTGASQESLSEKSQSLFKNF